MSFRLFCIYCLFITRLNKQLFGPLLAFVKLKSKSRLLAGGGILMNNTLCRCLVDLLDGLSDNDVLICRGSFDSNVSLLIAVLRADLAALLRAVLVAITLTRFLADLMFGISLHLLPNYE